MKKIGISCGIIHPDSGSPSYSKKTLYFVEQDTFRYFDTEDTMPFAIPYLHDDSFERMLALFDGIVLHGGSDIAPETYNEKPIGNWLGDRIRDEYEFRIMKFAMKHKKPVLGLCRGCHLINVYFGGTLYQDIGTQTGSKVSHKNTELYDLNYHSIQFSGKNLVSDLYPAQPESMVSSIHHQAIKDLSDELEIIATSPDDGIIEAVHHKTAKNLILGIQWHPEFHYHAPEKLLDPKKLLDLFIDAM